MSGKLKLNENAGEGIEVKNADWTFGGKTVEVFSQHIKRSVPLYSEGHNIVCKLSDFFVNSHSVCYEIGISVGELFGKLIERHQAKTNCKWIGLDSEKDMITMCKKTIPQNKNVSLEVDDIVLYDLEKSDLIVSYYCIQFIPPKFRQIVINKIYQSLNWGGGFIWFEKVRGCDARFQDIFNILYIDYKLEQQYTPDEIITKMRSLKGVLEPFSTQGNLDLLTRAGFVDIISVFKYLNFEGYLCIK